MKSKLHHQRYGKQRVRFLRVIRDSDAHRVMDVKAGISLEGEFLEAYYTENNQQVVATDTMKNTLIVLGHDDPGDAIETYGLRVVNHFLAEFAHVKGVTLTLEEKPWVRAQIDGQAQPVSFEGGTVIPTARIIATRNDEAIQAELWSGVKHWELLKTTGSGFVGFPRDAFTTLPETRDRILATEATVEWRLTKAAIQIPIDFPILRERLLATLLKVFATEYSPSVQRTLFQMGDAALSVAPEIDSIRLAMPNKHYLPLDLTAFGKPHKQNICFLPTDEPHGQIEAEITRE